MNHEFNIIVDMPDEWDPDTSLIEEILMENLEGIEEVFGTYVGEFED